MARRSAFDAHVRARSALVSLVARHLSGGTPELRRQAASAGLAAYRWPPGWGIIWLTAYAADGLSVGVEAVGVCKAVPAINVRGIVSTAQALDRATRKAAP
jgi:hypothetical protein